MERHIFSVTEVNQLVKSLVDGEPRLQNLLVRGELSNFKTYPSGHCYFSLKDQDGALRCVMFRGQASQLRFRPENGMKVILRGRVSVFPRDGAYQFYCDAMTPEGVGDLALAFEQLKEKLHREGLFDPAHKKPLPPFPERIAVVTSPAGAAVHDMIRILRQRYPLAKVILLPVRVQGAEAPPEIAGAIRYADRWKIGDILITGRGGGSMEDLWAFNDERVARAIYACETPVISAVGHEPDVTIADFVADVRASTPSNAAERAVPDQAALRQGLLELENRLVRSQRKRLEVLRQQLAALAEKRVLTDRSAYVQDKRMELAHLQQRMERLAGDLIPRRQTELEYLRQRAADQVRLQIIRRRESFSTLAASLDAMSPLKVLGRGYAVAQSRSGKLLRSYRDVSAGEQVSVALEDGGFTCTVEQPYQKERQS